MVLIAIKQVYMALYKFPRRNQWCTRLTWDQYGRLLRLIVQVSYWVPRLCPCLYNTWDWSVPCQNDSCKIFKTHAYPEIRRPEVLRWKPLLLSHSRLKFGPALLKQRTRTFHMESRWPTTQVKARPSRLRTLQYTYYHVKKKKWDPKLWYWTSNNNGNLQPNAGDV